MTIDRLISSDDHVIEPPDLWTSRAPRDVADRVPRVVRGDDADWWVVGGVRTQSFSAGVQTGKRFHDPLHLQNFATFEEVRPGGFDAQQHLVDNAADGIVGAVLYPTLGLSLF